MERSRHKDYFVCFLSSFTLCSCSFFIKRVKQVDDDKQQQRSRHRQARKNNIIIADGSILFIRFFFVFLLFFISSEFDFRSYTWRNSKLEIGKLSCCCSAAQYGKREKKIYFQEMKMLKNELPNVIICWNFHIFNFPISPLSFAGRWRTKRHNVMPNQT